MANLVIRGAKLFPASQQAGAISFASAFIYEPHQSQRELGELYAVAEILSSAKNPQAVADLIIENFGKTFYAEPESDEETTDTDSAERFDRAVKATNQALAHYTGHDDATWIGKTSIVIAAAAGNELHVTHTGSTEAYLLRKGSLTRIDARDTEHKHQTHKPFTSIVSGHLEPGDRLMLCTPALMRIISKEELKDLLGESSANAAANKIAELIEHETGAERVAAVLAEATTADLIADRPLPDEPPEVMLGTKKNGWQSAAASAKDKAIPLLKKAHTHAKPLAGKAARAAGKGWHLTKTRVAPAARHHGLRAASWLRERLKDPKKAKIAIVIGAVVIILLGVLIGGALKSRGQGNQIKLYDQALSITREGQQLWLDGNKADAKTKLESAQKVMDELEETKPGKKLDEALAKRSHPDYDPASVSKLDALIQDILDQIAGLSRMSPKELASLSDVKGSNPSFMELIGNQLVIVGANESPTVTLVNIADGKISPLAASKDIGKVVDTAPTTGGVYLLTSEPAVWLLNTSANNITKQTGSWQAGKSIATFGSNVYILKSDNSQILRYTKTGSDFGSPTAYLASGQSSRLAGAEDLTVDGAVITGGGSSLLRFFTGTLAETGTGLPDTFGSISQVLSVLDGETILILDGKSGRIGSVTYDSEALAFANQYVLTSGDSIKSLASSDGITVYALYQDKVVSFTLTQ